jgi:hypothetical protein
VLASTPTFPQRRRLHERCASVKSMFGCQPSGGMTCSDNAGEVIEGVEAHRRQYIGHTGATVKVCLRVDQYQRKIKKDKEMTHGKQNDYSAGNMDCNK